MRLAVDLRLPLDRFALEVAFTAARTVTGVFGPSGSGKSSLLEAIAGLRRGVRGSIALGTTAWLDSSRGIELPPERRGVGFVPQDGLLFPHLDVRGNLLAGRSTETGPGLDTIAELLELTPLLDRDVVALSGGERQRVALGRALCSAPRLLLLDEPLAALDLPLRRRLLPMLGRVRQELEIPMLLVSHDPIEVQALCDELIVLQEGRAIAQGEPRQVLTDPRTFPLALREGYENVFSGRLVAHGEGTSTIRLDSGVELIAGRTGFEVGRDVLVGLPANEILLAIDRPRGLSARNLLPARVVEIRSAADHTLVVIELAAGVPPLVVEVTPTTPARLGLGEGAPVFAVVKATSFRLYG